MKARERGIEVRLLIDSYIHLAHNDCFFSPIARNRELQRAIKSEWLLTVNVLEHLKKVGVMVKITNPLGIFKHRALFRDHKKMVIVDAHIPNRAIAYIGGMNISDHNASWNDCMMKMSGDMLAPLNEDYNKTWDRINRGGVARYSEGLVLSDARRKEIIMPVVLDLVSRANAQVVVQTPYLWGAKLRAALEKAVKRGVDVAVIVPLHNHKKLLVPTVATLMKMTAAGIRVHLFRANGGMTHAKLLIVDNVILFGSHNFHSITSGKMDEVGIVTNSYHAVSEMKRFVQDNIVHSVLMR